MARLGCGPSLLCLQCLLLIASCQQSKVSLDRQGRRLVQQKDHLADVLSRYLSNEELEAHLHDFVGRCGDIAKLSSAGKSAEGRELWVLEIADRPGQPEAEPSVKYVGNIHGDEPSGRVLALALAEWLCANHKTDEKAKRLVNDLHLFLMPSMNPDGFALKTRGNKERKDLNRDFPDRYAQPDMRPRGNEQPETKALMSWSLEGAGFVASASFHEGAVLANYPWDGTPHRTTEYWASPDDATFKYLARTYASNHRTMGSSQEFKEGITNGAAWYPIYGSMQDWSYVAGGCYELTLELSDNKWPPEHALPTLWEDNKQALLEFPLRAGLGGLRGTVKEQAAKLRTGKGQELRSVVANISVVGIDHVTRSHQPFGDFYRPLPPGSYGVLVTREGCQPFSANITVPEDGSGAVLDVVLTAQPGGGGEGGVAGSGSGSGSGGGGSGGSREGVGGGHSSGAEPEVQPQEGEKAGAGGSSGEQAAKGVGEAAAAAAAQPEAGAAQGDGAGAGIVDAAPGADTDEEVEEMLKLWQGEEQQHQQHQQAAATARQAAEQQQQQQYQPSAALPGGAAGSGGGLQSSLLWGTRVGQGQEGSSWLGQPLLLAAVGVFAIWVANSRLRRRGQPDRLRGD